MRDAAAETDSAPRLVVNGAEGEPGTYKGTVHDEFNAHLGRTCDAPVLEQVPKIESLDDTTGEVAYDPTYQRKRSDWSYAPADATRPFGVSALAFVGPWLVMAARRAAMTTSILVQDRAEPAAHLTHLIEPAHRIAHARHLAGVDDHRDVSAA